MPFRALDPATAVAAPVTLIAAPNVSVGETLSSLRDELTLELSTRGDVDPTRINKWINWGYQNVAGMLKINELKRNLVIVTVAGQPFYMLPIQVRSIMYASVRDSGNFIRGGIELLPSNEGEYRRQSDSSTIYNRGPRNYFRYGRMLVVYPDPITVQSVDLDVYIRPDDLVADTDSPLLPKEFHEALLLSAKHRAWRSLRNYQEANLAANDMLTVLRPLIDTDAEEADNVSRGLTVARKASDLTRSRR